MEERSAQEGAGRRPTPRPGRATLLRRVLGLLALLALAPASADARAEAGAGSGRRTEAASTTFVVIGHLRGNRTGTLWPWMDLLLEEVRQVDPDRVFLTGDLVWGDYDASPVDVAAVEADWERLDAALAPVGAPIHRVPGNHDTNDPATRALFHRRYGELPAAVRHGRDLFVLLDSTRTDPAEPPALPRPHARVERLAPDRRESLRRLLAEAAPYRHAFVFLHHVLWWEDDASWWREVHPLLREAGVRAVFAGDFGPLKLSHVARDGVAYWQTAVEGPTRERLLRRLEGARLLHVQPDNFLEVQVDEAGVRVEVHPVALEASGRLTPGHYRAITAPPRWTLGERVERVLGGPLRQGLLALVALGLLAVGAVAGGAWARRRPPRDG